MSVCIYIYTYIHTYIHIHACLHACMHAYIHTYIHAKHHMHVKYGTATSLTATWKCLVQYYKKYYYY